MQGCGFRKSVLYSKCKGSDKTCFLLHTGRGGSGGGERGRQQGGSGGGEKGRTSGLFKKNQPGLLRQAPVSPMAFVGAAPVGLQAKKNSCGADGGRQADARRIRTNPVGVSGREG